jgi:hypothetical protein
MVSLIAREERRRPPPRPPKGSSKPTSDPRRLRSGRSESSSTSSRGSGKMKKRSPKQADEELVSLIASDGKPTPAPGQSRKKKTNDIPWTFTRLMKYLSLTGISFALTFLILQRQSRAVHWEEYKHVLDPEVSKHELRCFVSYCVLLC